MKLNIHYIRKRHVTLLEVLIAMSLMSILIVSVLGFYSQFEGINQEIATQRKKAFYALYLQSRLGNVIPFASSYKIPKSKDKEFTWFYSSTEGEQPSLIFVFDNGVDGIPLYSELVLGKLYIDPQKRMILATWPLPKLNQIVPEPPPMRKEVLYENVQKLTFRFYQPPRRDLPEQPIALGEGPPGFDNPYWGKDKESIPPLMKMIVEPKDGDPLTMTFVMVYDSQPILYQTGEQNQ